ncbi:MAG: transposase [Magnetococcales bacterium]|nr:transposase [Magnetococcales bacterium]
MLSTPLSADRFGEVVQAHWGIKNSVHWVLDVVLNEDQNRSRKGNGPNNPSILRHMALKHDSQGTVQRFYAC